MLSLSVISILHMMVCKAEHWGNAKLKADMEDTTFGSKYSV